MAVDAEEASVVDVGASAVTAYVTISLLFVRLESSRFAIRAVVVVVAADAVEDAVEAIAVDSVDEGLPEAALVQVRAVEFKGERMTF